MLIISVAEPSAISDAIPFDESEIETASVTNDSEQVIDCDRSSQADCSSTIPVENDSETTSCHSWLDMTSDGNADEVEQVDVGKVVQRLLKDAWRHKAFAAVFKLQAIKNYLELYEKYRRVPQIKNPKERASVSVACSIGKGPYFA